jgi:N6-L-threonylcarbamoyladenine synthase
MTFFAETYGGPGALVVAGGVAANVLLRQTLAEVAGEAGFTLVAPPLSLCTDNAAMIAWAGLERFRLGQQDGLDFAPRPRWPLDPQAKQLRGAGVKA